MAPSRCGEVRLVPLTDATVEFCLLVFQRLVLSRAFQVSVTLVSHEGNISFLFIIGRLCRTLR